MQIYVATVLISIAVGCDLKTGKVPNPLIAIGCLLGFGLLLVDGLQGVFTGIIGFFEAFMILILPFAGGMLGAGDVKLLMMIGCYVGSDVWRIIWYSAIATAVFGFLMHLFQLIRYRKEHRFLQLFGKRKLTRIHFTIPILAGFVWFVLRDKGAWL